MKWHVAFILDGDEEYAQDVVVAIMSKPGTTHVNATMILESDPMWEQVKDNPKPTHNPSCEV